MYIASNPGAEEGEKSAWYPLSVHALNHYIKPRGFMQMTSQNYPSVNNDVYTTQRNHEDMIAALTLTFGTWSVISAMRDETTMTTLSSRASFTSNTNGITHNDLPKPVRRQSLFVYSLQRCPLLGFERHHCTPKSLKVRNSLVYILNKVAIIDKIRS